MKHEQIKRMERCLGPWSPADSPDEVWFDVRRFDPDTTLSQVDFHCEWDRRGWARKEYV